MSLLPMFGGLDRLLNGSQGMQAARMLETLGLPPGLAEMAGATVDGSRGDLAGVQRLMMAATQGLSMGQMDSLFGKGLPPAGFVPRPLSFMQPDLGIGRGFNPFGGTSREAPFGTGFVGRSMERAIRRDPFFRAQMERQLGGHIIPDRRNDGRITVWRPPFSQVGNIMKNALTNGLLPGVGMAATFGALSLPLGGAIAANAITGSILRGMQRMEGNMASFMHGLVGDQQGAAKAQLMADPQAGAMAEGMGINIANASFEDILFLLMMKYAKKKEDDIMKKVKDLDQAGINDKNKAGGGGKGGLGGILGAAGGIVGNMVAPGIGGAVGGMAGNMLGGALQGGGGAGQSQGLYGAGLGENMDAANMSETMKQQMMQKLMGDLNKLYEMLSNMIKSMHDMSMTPVRNLRG